MRVLPILGLLALNVFSQETDFKNLIRISSDQHFRYDRLFGWGFQIGTEIRYRLLIEGNRLLHMDQQPEWSFSIANAAEIKGITIENRLGFLGFPNHARTIQYNGWLLKKFALKPNLDFSPSLNIIEYAFDPENSGSRYSPVHHLLFTADVGLNLDWKF